MDSKTYLIPEEIAETLVDAAAYTDHRIHDACAWLRANNPLGYAVTREYPPFWAVTRQQDIKVIALANEVFSTEAGSEILLSKKQEARLRELTGRASMLRSLPEMDEPEHGKYRQVFSTFFRQANIRTLEDQIRPIAKQFVSRMADMGGQCDFAKDIAFLYPLHSFMRLLGVPSSDEPLILKLATQYTSMDADITPAGVVPSGSAAADFQAALAREFETYFDAKLAERRAHPREDILSLVANAQIDGEPMPLREALSNCQMLAIAGHETTSFATSGGIVGLCQNPGEFAKAKADPLLIPGLVDEAVRWTSPAKLLARTVIRDVHTCNRNFRSGDKVGLFFVSGNRDEAVFPDPFTFRIDRNPNRMIGFGWGVHNCLGQFLARLELRVFYEELLMRLSELELTGEPIGMASVSVNGPKSVPIRYRMN